VLVKENPKRRGRGCPKKEEDPAFVVSKKRKLGHPKKTKKKSQKHQLESFIFPDFLSYHPELNEKIQEFLDGLFLSDFRKPWTPGEGICLSADAPYNCNLQISLHRPSYHRSHYSREDQSIKCGDGNIFRYTYGTGSGRITHGIPMR
jgi:hypothetical protein